VPPLQAALVYAEGLLIAQYSYLCLVRCVCAASTGTPAAASFGECVAQVVEWMWIGCGMVLFLISRVGLPWEGAQQHTH